MADNVILPGTNEPVATDDIAADGEISASAPRGIAVTIAAVAIAVATASRYPSGGRINPRGGSDCQRRYCGICLRKSSDSSFNCPQRGKKGLVRAG